MLNSSPSFLPDRLHHSFLATNRRTRAGLQVPLSFHIYLTSTFFAPFPLLPRSIPRYIYINFDACIAVCALMHFKTFEPCMGFRVYLQSFFSSFQTLLLLLTITSCSSLLIVIVYRCRHHRLVSSSCLAPPALPAPFPSSATLVHDRTFRVYPTLPHHDIPLPPANSHPANHHLLSTTPTIPLLMNPLCYPPRPPRLYPTLPTDRSWSNPHPHPLPVTLNRDYGWGSLLYLTHPCMGNAPTLGRELLGVGVGVGGEG
eukprot:748321-Hanusia_phi.AAC.1